MSEANRTWGDHEWSTRLPLLYRVIEGHVSAAVSFALPYDHYREVFAGKPIADNPYHIAFLDMIALILHHQHLLKITEPIDFVFDRGNDERILKAWDKFVEAAPAGMKDRIGKKPQFGDDEEMLPLQAADLLAWWTRRRIMSIADPTLKTRKAPWVKSRDILHLELAWEVGRMQEAFRMMYGDGP